MADYETLLNQATEMLERFDPELDKDSEDYQRQLIEIIGRLLQKGEG